MMLLSADPKGWVDAIIAAFRGVGEWRRRRGQERDEALSGVTHRPLLRTDGFKDREEELQHLRQLVTEKRGVIWVTGPAQAGKSWLVSACVRASGLQGRAGRFELRRGDSLEALQAGINGFLCAKNQMRFNAACGNPKLTPVQRIGPLLHVIDRSRWLILLDSYDRVGEDSEVHSLVEEMQRSLRECTVVVGSHRMPEWATEAGRPAEIPLGGIEKKAGKELLSESGLPDEQLDELYEIVGGLPGALVNLGVLVRKRGVDAVRSHLRGTVASIGEKLFGGMFDEAGEGTKKLWAGLSLLPGPMTWEAARDMCELEGFPGFWDELVEWKLLAQGERGAELLPLARAVGEARLEGLGDWAKECGRRVVKFYAHFAHEKAKDRAAVEGELENVLAAARLASRYREWEALQEMGYALVDPLGQAGRWRALVELLRLCHRGAQDADDAPRRRDFAHELGRVLQDSGDLAAARRLYRESLSIAQRMGDGGPAGRSLHQLGWIAQLRGELDEAARLYQQSMEITKKEKDKRGTALSLHQLGTVAQRRGELDEAERLYGEGLKIRQGLPDRVGEAATLHDLGIVARLRGNLDTAWELFERSLNIEREEGDRPGEATTLYEEGFVQLLRGKPDEAKRLANDSLETGKEIGMRMQEPRTLQLLGMVAEERGDTAGAERLYERSLEKARAVEDRPGEARALQRLGVLAQKRARLDEAKRIYDEALAIARKMGYRPDVARIVAERGRLAETRGDLRLAVERMEEAVGMFEEMGLAEAERAREELERSRRRLEEEGGEGE